MWNSHVATHNLCWCRTSDVAVTSFCRASSYTTAVLGVVILSVCPSVRLSVTHVLCDKTRECTADILIPHERTITLVFWHQQWLVGDAPSV